jgi:hypothetical protein
MEKICACWGTLSRILVSFNQLSTLELGTNQRTKGVELGMNEILPGYVRELHNWDIHTAAAFVLKKLILLCT